VPGTRIPTLAEVFALVRRSGDHHVRLNIETKIDPTHPEESPDPEHFVAVHRVGEPLEGVEQLIRHAERLWAGFPDVRLERTGERLANRHYVAAPCKLLGTHKEPLEGLPATNRFVVVHCVFYCELQRQRLLRVRGFFDLYDAAVQLGVLPSRGSLGAKALLVLRGLGLRAARGQ